MGRLSILFVAVLTCAPGCGPSVRFVRNPGPEDLGLRYFRPKPYVLVAPVVLSPEAETAKASLPSPSASTYRLSVCYLPDFAEEGSVHIRPGLGTSRMSINLENGWNLTSISHELDSKTPEKLEAAVGLIRAINPGGFGGPGSEAHKEGPSRIPDVIVLGHEVPIGFYEAVIVHGAGDGKKQLGGFRYVGFFPFATGPISTMAWSPHCFAEGPEPLYGLVSERGMLVFKPLDELAAPTPLPGVISAGPEISGKSTRPAAVATRGAPAAKSESKPPSPRPNGR